MLYRFTLEFDYMKSDYFLEVDDLTQLTSEEVIQRYDGKQLAAITAMQAVRLRLMKDTKVYVRLGDYKVSTKLRLIYAYYKYTQSYTQVTDVEYIVPLCMTKDRENKRCVALIGGKLYADRFGFVIGVVPLGQVEYYKENGWDGKLLLGGKIGEDVTEDFEWSLCKDESEKTGKATVISDSVGNIITIKKPENRQEVYLDLQGTKFIGVVPQFKDGKRANTTYFLTNWQGWDDKALSKFSGNTYFVIDDVTTVREQVKRLKQAKIVIGAKELLNLAYPELVSLLEEIGALKGAYIIIAPTTGTELEEQEGRLELALSSAHSPWWSIYTQQIGYSGVIHNDQLMERELKLLNEISLIRRSQPSKMFETYEVIKFMRALI